MPGFLYLIDPARLKHELKYAISETQKAVIDTLKTKYIGNQANLRPLKPSTWKRKKSPYPLIESEDFKNSWKADAVIEKGRKLSGKIHSDLSYSYFLDKGTPNGRMAGFDLERVLTDVQTRFEHHLEAAFWAAAVLHSVP